MSPNLEQSTLERVWYASYGSNLKRDRFMCYIEGGIPDGTTKRYLGCRDKSEPVESRPIQLKFELYFAGRSKTWGNGGVAFIRETPRGSMLGRMYLITYEQFNDTVIQESSKRPDGSRFVPTFEKLVCRPIWFLPHDAWYGKIVNIGLEGKYPILTFTTVRSDLQHPTAPSEQYVEVIASGIKETYPQMSNDDIVGYLSRADGLRGQIDLPKIRGWVAAE